LLLAASHTHLGPQTCENMVGVGEMVAEVVAMVQERTLDGAAMARRHLRPVTLSVGQGRCEGYTINRRLVREGVCLFAPNPDGVRDDEVTVLVFRDAQDGTVVAVLFHFTCYPTVIGDQRITADYPGATRRVIERAFNEAAAGFLPGCFGDVRPNCTFIGGTKFRQGQHEDVALFGDMPLPTIASKSFGRCCPIGGCSKTPPSFGAFLKAWADASPGMCGFSP